MKTGGISFFGLLTIVFIVLKLTNVITWGWFWVLSPTLIPIIMLGLFLLGAGLLSIIYGR